MPGYTSNNSTFRNVACTFYIRAAGLFTFLVLLWPLEGYIIQKTYIATTAYREGATKANALGYTRIWMKINIENRCKARCWIRLWAWIKTAGFYPLAHLFRIRGSINWNSWRSCDLDWSDCSRKILKAIRANQLFARSFYLRQIVSPSKPIKENIPDASVWMDFFFHPIQSFIFDLFNGFRTEFVHHINQGELIKIHR